MTTDRDPGRHSSVDRPGEVPCRNSCALARDSACRTYFSRKRDVRVKEWQKPGVHRDTRELGRYRHFQTEAERGDATQQRGEESSR